MVRQISPRNGDRNRRRRDARRHRTLEKAKGLQKMRSLAELIVSKPASQFNLSRVRVKRVSRLYVTRRDPEYLT